VTNGAESLPSCSERLNRRSALKVLCASGLCSVIAPGFDTQCSTGALDSNFVNYTFVFFTPGEQLLLNDAMDVIIPADEHSPGASEAKVPAFADLMVSISDDATQRAWRDGLRSLNDAVSTSSLDSVLASFAAQEENPQTELEKFWPVLKLMTVRGYYTSSIGIHQDMQYQGNQYRTSAPACNHPEHQ
jgi:hypothetical protein